MNPFIPFFVGVFLTLACVWAYSLIQISDDEDQPGHQDFDRCLRSRYGFHSFPGGGRCVFCGRALEDCVEGERSVS